MARGPPTNGSATEAVAALAYPSGGLLLLPSPVVAAKPWRGMYAARRASRGVAGTPVTGHRLRRGWSDQPPGAGDFIWTGAGLVYELVA